MRTRNFLIGLVSALLLVACGGSSTPDEPEGMSVQERVEATTDAIKTATAELENAVRDALTASAPVTTDTPVPSPTTEPTDTPAPTDTPEPTYVPSIWDKIISGEVEYTDCRSESGGRTKVNINNTTGYDMYLNLVGPENYHCLVRPGEQSIYILSGYYQYLAIACGNPRTFRGGGPITTYWIVTFSCD